jgi:DNA polymerase-1
MYPGSYPTILGVSFQPGGAWIIPLAHKESVFRGEWTDGGEWVKVLQYFGREVIENPDIIKIGQNIKYEMNWWHKYGITMVGRVFDTMLAKYLLDEERPHGLKPMVTRFIPEYDGYDLPGQPGPKASTEKLIEFWSNVPLHDLSQYCALDADLTFRLWIFFERRLIDSGFYTLFRNMMMMASRVLAEAEWRGMTVDRDYLKGLVEIYAVKIEECENRIRNNPVIIRYEKARLKAVKKEMIKEVREEIRLLKETEGSDRMIKSREEKVSRYIAGEYTTKKEREKVEVTNFNSPAQMIELLFESPDGFKFPVVKFTMDKKTKKETKRPSTDEDVLEELKPDDDSGFIKDLLELRGLTKLNSTYVVGMWERLTSKNKIHGSFLLHGTVTGRLSSRNPNLQNIPRDTTASDIKKMFIAPPGKLLLQIDYSQAELRVLAAAAKEKTMMEWFATGRDVHLASACLKWGEDYDKILKIYKDESNKEYEKWKIRRKQAKTINFGIVYGQTARKLADSLSTDDYRVSSDEAQEFLDNFNDQFPAIVRYIVKQQKFARANGFVYNLFGRKRRLLNVDSDNWGKRKKAEAFRQAVNAPIQGAASDFTLFSSILIRENIHRHILPQSLEQVGTVHDSLIFYIDPAEIHKAIPILYQICRNPETMTWFDFEVKGIEMKVDFEMGKNWGELHGYVPEENYLAMVA